MPVYESRLCELKECDILFIPNRKDKVYCSVRHCNIAASRNYRVAHGQKRDPTIQIPRRNQARACRDFVRRDTPKLWMAYMEQNPEYTKGVLRGRTLADVQKSMIWS
jgi:hypothetical protein